MGTFHFDYPGLDGHKTIDDDKIDVLSVQRQKEMNELVNYIKQFKPNKIVIEGTDSHFWTNELKKFKNGKVDLKRDERYQLGVRIASEMTLDTLYALDATTFAEELQEVNSEFSAKLWKDYDWNDEGELPDRYNEWSNYKDQLAKEIDLLTNFKYINSEESHTYEYGSYLTGDFELDENRGADVLSIYWYNRNLRIFRKIQEINNDKNDRILIIFGNGHASLFRQFFSSSSEFDYIEFNSL